MDLRAVCLVRAMADDYLMDAWRDWKVEMKDFDKVVMMGEADKGESQVVEVGGTRGICRKVRGQAGAWR